MRNRILVFMVLLTSGITLSARQTFSGKVVSTDGRPLEGVIVSVSGGRASAITDAAGNYQLTTEARSGSLEAVLSDYYSKKYPLKESAVPEVIVMVPESEMAYSGRVVLPNRSFNRGEAPATLESFYKKDMREGTSADMAWQDLSSSLLVNRKSGMPGEGAYFNIRGMHTLNAENTPLLVVNGVPFLANIAVSDVLNAYSRDALFGYNPQDIRSITVLKGSEAAMYGSLASNGVILIETEQATSDNLDTRISFSGQYGLSKVQSQIPVLGVTAYRDYLMEVAQTRYPSIAALQKDYPFLSGNADNSSYLFDNQTDWKSLIYEDAFVTDNVLRVEGGDEVAKYNISFGYTREEGVLSQTRTERYHTAMNTNIMVSPDFEIFTSVNLAYINSKLNNSGMSEETNPILSAYHMMPNLHPYQKLSNGGIIEGRYLRYNSWNVNPNPSFAYDNVSNPLALVNTVEATDKIYDANVCLGLNYRPNQRWLFSGMINLYYDYTEEYVFTPGVSDQAILPQLYGMGENFVSMGIIRQEAYYYDLKAAYKNCFDDIHDVNVYAGARLMTKSYEYDASSGYNSANDYYRTLSKVSDEWNIFGNNDDWKWLSFYMHGDYLYDNLWRANLSLTADASSVSGAEASRFGFFPSGSLTYMLGNTGVFSEKLDHLNITAEASLTGNSRFSSNYGRNYYVSNNLFNLGTIVRNGVPNARLEWEKKAQVDLAVDLAAFRNKLNFRLGAYYAHHYDLLLDSKISSAYGSNETYYDNTASINNRGIEIALRFNPIRTRDIDWILTLNAASLNSKIADLGEMDRYIQTYTAYKNDDAQTLLEVGEAPYAFYGYQTAGVYQTTEQARQATEASGLPLKNTYGNYYQGGDVIFVDQNNDGVINDEDRVALGTAAPDYYGSFGTSFRYKKWTFSADFGFSAGNMAYNATRRQTESMDRFYNQSAAVQNRWRIEGDRTDMPRAAYGDPSGNHFFSDRWIEDAGYLKLRRLKLSYKWDKKLFSFMDGQLWMAAENLWTLSGYLGADPEFSYSYAEALRGFDYAKVSKPVTFRLGVQFNF